MVDALRVAAVAIDRLWWKKLTEDSRNALHVWQGLVNGEWSLVDAFDNDGRRFLVARRNAHNRVESSALSHRERRVLALRARVFGVKTIAYELGVSTATVSRDLRTAMRKLGVTHSMDLVSLVTETRPS